jgi:hypothetical protein
MRRRPWFLALGLSLMVAAPTGAEIIKGVMSVRGAEMS